MESKDKIRVLVTGASGMVGEGVLLECLQNPAVEAVLVIGRRSCGITHPKLQEILHADFFDITPLADRLGGYHACFFCLGVSSVGMKEPEYYRLTYTLTLHVARVLSARNPDMSFCYVSGAGTDSSEQGRSMWARVKGKTENDLRKLPFRAAYAFRPGVIEADTKQKNLPGLYKWLSWLIGLMKWLMPRYVCNVREIGRAMIGVSRKGYVKNVIEISDIKQLAAQQDH